MAIQHPVCVNTVQAHSSASPCAMYVCINYRPGSSCSSRPPSAARSISQGQHCQSSAAAAAVAAAINTSNSSPNQRNRANVLVVHGDAPPLLNGTAAAAAAAAGSATADKHDSAAAAVATAIAAKEVEYKRALDRMLMTRLK
jgi:hypothetical protein